MLNGLEDSLKSNVSTADMFYVTVLMDSKHEFIPLEVNFEDVFYDIVEIRTESALIKDKTVLLNMFTGDIMYNISGRVLRSVPEHGLFLSTIRVEDLPAKLFNELISMMKDRIGEAKEK